MFEGGRTPLIPAVELADLGYRLMVIPSDPPSTSRHQGHADRGADAPARRVVGSGASSAGLVQGAQIDCRLERMDGA